MNKEMGTIKLVKTDNGIRVDITGELANRCCCCGTDGKKTGDSRCCETDEKKADAS